MPSLAKPTLWLSFVLSLGLTHCADDDKKKVVAGDAGSGTEAGSDSGPGSGGSESNVQGGAPTGEAGAAAIGARAGSGEQAGAGGDQGGMPGSGGTGAMGGMSTSNGGACNVEPDPTNCCQAADLACAEDWELVCYNDWNTEHFCCDAELGVRRSCEYDGDFYRFSDVVCLDECTGKSFGTGSCDECLEGAPACPAIGGCGVDNETCEDASAGYVKWCFNGSRVQCVCDPTL